MAKFDIGETVICSIVVKDSDGNEADPGTSMKCTVTDPQGTVVVDGEDMDQDSTGNYHYDYTSLSTAMAGAYSIKYIADDDGRITIQKDKFVLE